MFQRQRTGSVVCPSCGSLVGVNDARCYRCGRANPGLWGFAPLLNKLGDFGFTEATMTACAALYVICLLADPSAIGQGGLLGLLSPGQRPLFLLGASGALPVFGYGRWWTVLSAAWLHGGLLHIGFNLLWLRQLMPAVSQLYGTSRLIIIYTAGAIGGFAITSFMGLLNLPWPLRGAVLTVGASAPMFGLFGALIVYSSRVGASHIGQQVWRWVIMFSIFGLIVPLVDNWAHLGGFAGGYVAARLLDPRTDENPYHAIGALVCLALSVASVVASFFHGLPLFRTG